MKMCKIFHYFDTESEGCLRIDFVISEYVVELSKLCISKLKER